MTATIGRSFGTTMIAAAIAVFAFGAQAQDKKVDPPKAAKTEKKVAACKTLKQEACDGRSDCNWVAEAKDDKGKVKKKAYCRGNPGTAKKAEVKKADPKKN